MTAFNFKKPTNDAMITSIEEIKKSKGVKVLIILFIVLQIFLQLTVQGELNFHLTLTVYFL